MNNFWTILTAVAGANLFTATALYLQNAYLDKKLAAKRQAAIDELITKFDATELKVKAAKKRVKKD